MTQKSVAKAKSDAVSQSRRVRPRLIGRPHAAWFPHTQADQARAAAKQLRLNVIEVTNGPGRRSRRQTSGWPDPCGRAAMVPPVREDLYEKFVATINPRGEAGQEPGEPIVTDLPDTLGPPSSRGTSS